MFPLPHTNTVSDTHSHSDNTLSQFVHNTLLLDLAHNKSSLGQLTRSLLSLKMRLEEEGVSSYFSSAKFKVDPVEDTPLYLEKKKRTGSINLYPSEYFFIRIKNSVNNGQANPFARMKLFETDR